MTTGLKWEWPTSSVLMCPKCQHRLCQNCRKRRRKSRKRLDWWEQWAKNYINCCQCGFDSQLCGWLGIEEAQIFGKRRFDEQFSMSENQFERERIAVESEVARGIKTQAAADEEIGQWVEDEANGHYVRQDDVLRRLAVEGEEETTG